MLLKLASGSAPCLLATSCPPPDTTGGKVVGLPPNTGSSFTFYWLDAGNNRQITYAYIATNGQRNSATATFNVDAPAGVTVGPPQGGQIQSTVNIVPPPTNTSQANPILLEGNIRYAGNKPLCFSDTSSVRKPLPVGAVD